MSGGDLAGQKLRESIKEAKAGSSISWPRLIATALAAVTMTLVSARLTSVFGSLMLTAVVSIGSALVAEFYRILINLTAEGTKKVIAPIVADEHGSQADSQRGEEEPNKKEDEPEQESSTPARPHAHSGQFVQLALVFGVVSLITVGISYGVAKSQGGDIYQNTFETYPTESLSDTEKQELVDQAVAAVKEAVPDAASFQDQLSSLQEQNEELQSALTDLQAGFETQQETMTTLTDQVGELERELEEVTGQVPPETTEVTE